MAGVILENVSTKKLVVICMFLLVLQLSCFIFGGLKAPRSTHAQPVRASWCSDKLGPSITSTDGTVWFPNREDGNVKACDRLFGESKDERIEKYQISAENIIFSFQYPLPRDGDELRMSRWFVYHTTVLSFDINWNEGNKPADNAAINLQVQVGYKDKGENEWNVLFKSTELLRYLKCNEPEKPSEGYKYECDLMDLFEVGDMHHEKYLVNIRMPPNPDTGHNMNIGELESVDLIWFAQTGGFTLFFLVMKTVFFALIFPLTVWNWKRIKDLNRDAVFLEKLLFGLALATLLLDFPIDWLVLGVRMPFMLLWSDIRQGFFLAVLFSFWLIFIGEHMVDGVTRGSWTHYWKQLATVILACIFMFIFDMCERGVRLVNPFFSIWATEQGRMVSLAFIGISIAASLIYFIILTVFIIKAIFNIWKKRSAFPSLTKGMRIHYMSIIYRFFFMLLFTLVCCTITVIAFVIGQLYEGQWKWDFENDASELEGDDEEREITSGISFEINTAFQLGVYGTWNVYVLSMLIFYAPSRKPARSVAIDDEDENDETVELTTIAGEGVRTRSSVSQANQSAVDENEETVQLTTERQTFSQEGSRIQYLAAKSAQE